MLLAGMSAGRTPQSVAIVFVRRHSLRLLAGFLLHLLLLACQAAPPATPAPDVVTPSAATTLTETPVRDMEVDLSGSPDGQWKAAWSESDASLHVTRRDRVVEWKAAFDPQRFGWDNGELRPLSLIHISEPTRP